jgi:hypothetical protein
MGEREPRSVLRVGGVDVNLTCEARAVARCGAKTCPTLGIFQQSWTGKRVPKTVRELCRRSRLSELMIGLRIRAACR